MGLSFALLFFADITPAFGQTITFTPNLGVVQPGGTTILMGGQGNYDIGGAGTVLKVTIEVIRYDANGLNPLPYGENAVTGPNPPSSDSYSGSVVVPYDATKLYYIKSRLYSTNGVVVKSSGLKAVGTERQQE